MSRMIAAVIADNVRLLLRPVARVIVAGSFRRETETVNDLDFIVILKHKVGVGKFLNVAQKHFGNVILGGKEGNRKAQYLWNGFLLDFYLTEKDKVEPMLLFLTGSAQTNIRMRAVAKAKGLALNQYGLFNRETEKPVGKQTERGIFETLGLDYLIPKER